MIHHIPHVLHVEQVQYFRERLKQATWTDGRTTTGNLAALVKNNQQLPVDHPIAKELGQHILDALAQHPLFLSAALPLDIMPPFFNQYEISQAFGFHVDNAIRHMPHSNQRIRTDLSCTLFLSDPTEYDGGELVIEDTYGYHEAKLPAGDMILYPSTSLHEVSAITSGCRVASFFWLQSMIRDDSNRHMLFQLDQSIQSLRAEQGNQHPQVVQLTSLYHNLIRKWAEM